ncbi:hypothetical protein [Heliothis virescens ascovirus 3e]|uniref:Uncharacterized protein n=1 Tax=Heliothis virescens ascovirus 3e TaxID=260797 RepID=A4KX90_HVAVE|nr:hypothetical protein HVAV3e_gp034 [Heliothis virescens ascovirus 3e]ABO37221.1 hypothetical protein [Heliothis virescens ascovirus 3e]
MERTRAESDGLGTLTNVAGDDKKLIDVAKNIFQMRCVAAVLQIYPDGSRKYDTMKLLQIAEMWFKDLHRTVILPNLFVGAFLASIPDDLSSASGVTTKRDSHSMTIRPIFQCALSEPGS